MKDFGVACRQCIITKYCYDDTTFPINAILTMYKNVWIRTLSIADESYYACGSFYYTLWINVPVVADLFTINVKRHEEKFIISFMP